jgi:hypothetical protein
MLQGSVSADDSKFSQNPSSNFQICIEIAESFCSIHKKKSESSKELFCVQFY